MSYATVGELKDHIGIGDNVDDAMLAAVLAAASADIDNYCGRRFDQVEETRTFSPRRVDRVLIDDCVSVTEVTTDDGTRSYARTWTAADYDLLPENAGEREPYTEIAASPLGNFTFPILRKGLRMTCVWGWPRVPEPIRNACLIEAQRLFKRKDAPFGITGTPEFGQMRITGYDVDVKRLLEPYRKIAVG